MDSIFFSKNTNLSFQILNEALTKEQIDNVIPFYFNGKDIFIQFYLAHDGVYFPEGAVVKKTKILNYEGDDYDELEIEVLYKIEQLKTMWEANKEHSTELKIFLETHIPFASDAGGNEFYIEIPTGTIKYISHEYGIDEGLFEVAPNFKDFCLAIESLY